MNLLYDEINMNAKKYYSDKNVLYAMAEYTKDNREFCMITPTWINEINQETQKTNMRMLRCHSTQSFEYYLQRFSFYNDRFHNLYYSLARYDGPVPKRDTAGWVNVELKQFYKNHRDHMDSFDFFIDIDSSGKMDVNMAYISARLLKKLFDSWNVPYQLRFSGKGFHFIIDGLLFKGYGFKFNVLSETSIFKAYSKMARWLNMNVSEMVDVNIYDSRRVIKLPYSLAIYKDNVQVCRPFLSNKEFNKWKYYDYSQHNIIEKVIPRRNKHIFKRYGNVSKLLKKTGVLKDGESNG